MYHQVSCPTLVLQKGKSLITEKKAQIIRADLFPEKISTLGIS